MAQAQGSLAAFKCLMEPAFNTAHVGAVTAKSKKIYYESTTLSGTRGMDTSKVMRGGTRHPTSGIPGNYDVAGSIPTELMATTFMWMAGLGSCTVANTGATMGTALTTPTAVINPTAQTMVITATSHGMAIGDSIEIAGLTAPTTLNAGIYPVIEVGSANAFTIRIPMDITSTFTLGSGTIKKVGSGTTKNIYTYKSGGNLPSYVIEKGISDIAVPKYFKYTGVKCGKLSFSVGASGVVSLASDWMGAQESINSASFDTGTSIDNSKISFNAAHIAAGDLKLGGVSSSVIKKVDIAIDNALDGDNFCVGAGGVRRGIAAQTYQITGSISAVFEDTALIELALAQTATSLELYFKRGTGAGTADNEYCQITIPELKFSHKTPDIPGPAGLMVDLTFTGEYTSNADATAMKVIIGCPQLPGAVF